MRICWCHIESCGPAVAFWVHKPSGNRVNVCRLCLDTWFDNADDDPEMEPLHWGWLPGCAPQPVLAA